MSSPGPESSSFVARYGMVVRSLRHRNYQLFFMGQGISLIGTLMQNVALSWLVYRLTGSALLLGVVAFSSQILTFAAAPFAGVLADRVNRRSVLVVTQSVATVQALVLAILTLAKVITSWHIIALSGVLGLAMGFDMPTRQAFVVEMVEERADLPNAIALNSFLFNGAQLIGPSLAGILIPIVGEGVCFLLNALSFLAVIAALLAMHVKPRAAHVAPERVFHSLKEGFAYVTGFKPILAMLLLMAALSLVGMPYGVLIPVFARDILLGGPRTYALLMSSTAVGAIVGALFLASQETVYRLPRFTAIAVGLFGAGIVGFSMSRTLWLSVGVLVVVGFGRMVQMASCNTLIQTLVDDDKRGRVMSLYTISFFGLAPFGSLLVGALAARLGAPWTVAINGMSCLCAGAVFAAWLPRFQRGVQPVCVRMGIRRE